MSKKKTSVPMFELMSRSRVGVGDPSQVEPQPEDQAGQARETVENHKKPVAVAVGDQKAASPKVPAPKRPQPAATFAPTPAEPMLQSGEGRLRISLNYVSSCVLVGGLLLLLAGAFVLGRKTAPTGPNEAGLGNDVQNPVPPTREIGKFYLVLARLPGGQAYRAQAEELVKFFEAKGLAADIQRQGDGKLLIWSFKPYDAPTSARAKAFAITIKNIAQEYQGQTGVEFTPGHAATGEQPWFEPKRQK